MTKFKPDQTYNIRKWSDFGSAKYGTCTITNIEEKPEDQIEWKPTSIKGCCDAEVGTITFYLNTAANNSKPKKARLIGSRVSEEWSKEFDCPREYQWFSPTGRSYRPLRAEKDFSEGVAE